MSSAIEHLQLPQLEEPCNPADLSDQTEQSHELHRVNSIAFPPVPSNEHTTPGIEDQSSRLPFRRLMSAYLCLAAIYFISTLDINSVATALPAISRSLDAGNSITWTGTAYLMGQTTFQALYGRLSDIFGRKPILLLSVGFLILGDLLCGFAQNVTWLYVCRALSGIGGGGISSLVQITVSDLVSLKDRGKYQGMLSGAIGLGAGTGPFIAAAMLGSGEREGWRWIFWIPPMLAATCLVVMWICLPLKPVTGSWKDKLGKIDWFGLAAAVAGILLILVCIFTTCAELDISPGAIDSYQFWRQYLAMAQRARHLHVGRGRRVLHAICHC